MAVAQATAMTAARSRFDLLVIRQTTSRLITTPLIHSLYVNPRRNFFYQAVFALM
ncbi:MAG: hypothetical protein R3B95_11055 [Nitrospirales bacterium]|nr:hypothetical protein [Nitrospirales bacterium]